MKKVFWAYLLILGMVFALVVSGCERRTAPAAEMETVLETAEESVSVSETEAETAESTGMETAADEQETGATEESLLEETTPETEQNLPALPARVLNRETTPAATEPPVTEAVPEETPEQTPAVSLPAPEPAPVPAPETQAPAPTPAPETTPAPAPETEAPQPVPETEPLPQPEPTQAVPETSESVPETPAPQPGARTFPPLEAVGVTGHGDIDWVVDDSLNWMYDMAADNGLDISTLPKQQQAHYVMLYFAAHYQYGEGTTALDMLTTGHGTCYAYSDSVFCFLRKMGISDCWLTVPGRHVDHDGMSYGSLHRSVVALFDGQYYDVDANMASNLIFLVELGYMPQMEPISASYAEYLLGQRDSYDSFH